MKSTTSISSNEVGIRRPPSIVSGLQSILFKSENRKHKIKLKGSRINYSLTELYFCAINENDWVDNWFEKESFGDI